MKVSMFKILVACAAMVFAAESASAALVYVSTKGGPCQLAKVDTVAHTVVCLPGLPSNVQIGFADSLALDPTGQFIYYDTHDTLRAQLHRYEISTATDTLMVDFFPTLGASEPQDLILEIPQGRNSILVSHFSGNVVTRTDTTAPFTTPGVNGAPPGPFLTIFHPEGLTYDNSGRLFLFAGSFGGTAGIYEINPTTGAILNSNIGFDSSNSLDGLTVDPATNLLYGTSRNTGVIWQINPDTLAAVQFTTIAPFPAPAAGDNGPDGIQAAKGNLYVASRGDMTLTVISIANPATRSSTPVDQIDDIAPQILDPPIITKSFTPNTIAGGGVGTSTLTFMITNPNQFVNLIGVGFLDTLPSPYLQLTAGQASPFAACGGTVTLAGALPGAGPSTVTLAGATVAANGGTCTFSVSVTGLAATPAAPPPTNNCVTPTSGNAGNGVEFCAPFVVLPPPVPLLISKSFTPATIGLNGTSTLLFTLTNPATNPTATGIAFTDTFPPGAPGVQLTAGQATPFAACGGSVALTGALPGAGPSTVALTGGTLLPGASCNFSVSVTGTAIGTQVNTTTTVTATNFPAGGPATATLFVVRLPDVTKSFNPTVIPVGGTSTLTISVMNPNTTSVTGYGFTDALPAGVTVAAGVVSPFSPGGTCAPGIVTAAGGSITLANATIAAGTTCTFTVLVTGTTPGPKNNCVFPAIPASCAILTVVGPPTILKTFTPPSVLANGVTTMNLRISNPAVNTVALAGVGLTDILPAGTQLAPGQASPFAACNGGSVALVVGPPSTVTLTGGSLGIGAFCDISLQVVGITDPGQDNCASVTSTTSGGNVNTNCARLTVTPPQIITDFFQVRYASNLNIGDSIVNLTNTGAKDGNDPAGRICVNVYTFDPAEELVSCCSCEVTPNGVNYLSARNDLISNTLTPGTPTSIVIKLIANYPVGTDGKRVPCDPASPTVENLAPGMRAWGTTLHALPGTPTPYALTETPFSHSPLSASELRKMTSFCGFIKAVGSGYGICASCRAGAAGGNAR